MIPSSDQNGLTQHGFSSDNTEKTVTSPFIRSVIDLTPDDIAPPKVMTKSERAKKSLRLLLILIFLLVFGFCTFFLIKTIRNYGKADAIYENIGEMIHTNSIGGVSSLLSSPVPTATPGYEECQKLTENDINDLGDDHTLDKEYEKIRNRLLTIKAQYPDLYGWIVLPNTNISYPVMKGEDNDYYLTHSYTGKRVSAGSIFADYRCEDTVRDNRNLVIFGHHMIRGGMFRSLDELFDEKFFRENGNVYLYTLEGTYTFKIFSLYQTNKYYHYIRSSFYNKDEFLTFAEEMRSNSIYQVEGINFTLQDTILTLSTCTNRLPDGRIAVHALLVDFTEA